MTPPDNAPEWVQRQERGTMFWLRVMTYLSLTLGRRLARTVVYAIALYFLLAVPAARRASRTYLARCLERRATWWEVYRHFLTFASTVHDRVYFFNDSTRNFDIRTQGTEAVQTLHHQQQGMLLFGAHLGSFEVLHTLAREDDTLKVSLAMFPDNAQQINRALRAINPRVVQDIVALGRANAILAIHQRLQTGAMVGILADRSVVSGDCARIDFLGAPADFALGPFRMAALLRQPVFFMAGIYQGGKRYDVCFEMLADFGAPASGNREALAREILEKYVRTLERHCRAAPFNWFNFYDFWKPVGHVNT